MSQNTEQDILHNEQEAHTLAQALQEEIIEELISLCGEDTQRAARLIDQIGKWGAVSEIIAVLQDRRTCAQMAVSTPDTKFIN